MDWTEFLKKENGVAICPIPECDGCLDTRGTIDKIFCPFAPVEPMFVATSISEGVEAIRLCPFAQLQEGDIHAWTDRDG